MSDYLIRVPAEWLEIHGGDAWIDADRLSGHEGRSFPVVAELPEDAENVTVEWQSESGSL